MPDGNPRDHLCEVCLRFPSLKEKAEEGTQVRGEGFVAEGRFAIQNIGKKVRDIFNGDFAGLVSGSPNRNARKRLAI